MSDATHIKLRLAEIQSGMDRVKWAEGLIRQLPKTHEGRNSWLLNYEGEKHSNDKATFDADELTRLREQCEASAGLRQRLALAEEIAASLSAENDRLAAAYAAKYAIVDRIWKQLGSPSYEELNGRSIHDLIDELKA